MVLVLPFRSPPSAGVRCVFDCEGYRPTGLLPPVTPPALAPRTGSRRGSHGRGRRPSGRPCTLRRPVPVTTSTLPRPRIVAEGGVHRQSKNASSPRCHDELVDGASPSDDTRPFC